MRNKIKDLFNFMLLFFYSKLSSRLQKIILKTFYKTFFFELSKVRFLKYYMVKIQNKSYPCVEFKDKVKLVGFLPTKYQLILTKKIFKNIPEKYIGVIFDYITRYKYSHLGIAIDKFDSPLNQINKNIFFHPQHLNFLREEKTIKEREREKVSKIFYPKKNWIILEIGSYTGFGALKFAKTYIYNGKIISFEAVKENYQISMMNKKLNNVKNWTIVNALIGDNKKKKQFDVVDRQADFTEEKYIRGNLIKKQNIKKNLTLKDLLFTYGPNIDLLSLTINGSEVEAIKSIQNINQKYKPARVLVPGWYKLNKKPRSKVILPILKKMGYKTILTKGNFIFGFIKSRIH